MVCRMSQGTVEFSEVSDLGFRETIRRLSGSGHHCSASNWPDTRVFNTVGFFLVLLLLNIIDISWVPPNGNAVHAWNCSKWTSSTSQYFWGVQMISKPETPKVTYFQFPQFNGQDAYRHSLWVTLHVWSWLMIQTCLGIIFGVQIAAHVPNMIQTCRNIVLSLWLLI